MTGRRTPSTTTPPTTTQPTTTPSTTTPPTTTPPTTTPPTITTTATTLATAAPGKATFELDYGLLWFDQCEILQKCSYFM